MFLWLTSLTGFAQDSLKFVPVHSLPPSEAKHPLATQEVIAAYKLPKPIGTAFYAISSQHWAEGLVPLFGVDRADRFELRRLPPRGQENFVEPLFFALPPEDEVTVTQIAGHWDCIATDSHDTKHYFAWEFAVDEERLSGRFDQNIDYRFAFITDGAFGPHQATLTIEYINARYFLQGEIKDRKFTGAWRREDDGDQGKFEAVRGNPPPAVPNIQETVPLYEWRRPADNARRYSIEPEINEPGWERSPRPLCRVWPAPPKQQDAPND